MTPEVRVDATKALAKFSPSGIPEGVRNNLRQVIPSFRWDAISIMETTRLFSVSLIPDKLWARVGQLVSLDSLVQ